VTALSDVPILICACGKRLRAPGAAPGRVGRCPACGGTLRVPRDPPPTERVAAPAGRKKTTKRAASRHETAIWDGLVGAPSRPEMGIGGSLLYPLWGATGVASLVILPPLLWVTSLPLLATVQAFWSGQSVAGLGLSFLGAPGLLGFTGVFGYTLLYLGRVAASSAVGEIHPPRWPDWELSGLMFGLGRWAWAGLVGVALGGVPATAYWVYCGDVDLFDALILGELLAVGAVYALMALLASILHEDALAANPFTVAAAIWRSGWGYFPPCLLAGFAALAAGTVMVAAFEIGNPYVGVFLLWVFWVVGLYEAMVVLRVLGLFYHKRARVLGWFRGRTGWGV